jgi:hypothetical protein
MKQYVVTYDSGWIDVPVAVTPTKKKEAISYIKHHKKACTYENSFTTAPIMKVYLIGNLKPIYNDEWY